MDEFQQVNNEAVSVMLYEIQSILLAMRAGLTTCTIDDGKEVRITLTPFLSDVRSLSKRRQFLSSRTSRVSFRSSVRRHR